MKIENGNFSHLERSIVLLVVLLLIITNFVILENDGTVLPSFSGKIDRHGALDSFKLTNQSPPSDVIYKNSTLDSNSTHILSPGYVSNTLVLANDSLFSGYFENSSNSILPQSVAFDYLNKLLYVAEYGSGTVSVVNASTNSDLITIPVGFEPTSVASVDSGRYIYVANSGSDNISIINVSKEKVVNTINVGHFPFSVYFDPENGLVYVSNVASDNVSVINPSTEEVVGSISVGRSPVSMTVDLTDGALYVADSLSNFISIINTTSETVEGNASTGSGPFSLLFDPTNGYIYVANQFSSNLSVLNPATEKAVYSIKVGADPISLAYSSSNGFIYVANSGSDNITVVNTSTDSGAYSLSGGLTPISLCYDPYDNEIYVADFNSNGLTCIYIGQDNRESFVVLAADPEAVLYLPQTGEICAAYGLSDSVAFINSTTMNVIGSVTVGQDPNSIAFSQTFGSVYVSNLDSDNVSIISYISYKVTGDIYIGGPPLGLAYDPVNNELYVTTYETIDGSLLYLVLAFDAKTGSLVTSISVSSGAGALAYNAHNNRIYVVNGESHDVSVIDPSIGKVVENITVGGYPNAISCDQINGMIYVSNSVSNYVSVINASTDSVVSVIKLGESSSPFSTIFNPLNHYLYVADYGTASVSVVNTSNNAVISNISVGYYPISLAINAKGDTIYVANSYSGTLSIINDSGVAYSVTFTESGIKKGTPWYVYLSNGLISENITGASFRFFVTNGTYSYSAYVLVSGYAPSNGLIIVTGNALDVSIAFSSLIRYTVYFNETELPEGSKWFVNLSDGNSLNSTTNFVKFLEPDGSYSFVVYTTDVNYAPDPSWGYFTINGTGFSQTILFSRAYRVNITESGLYSKSVWYLNSTKSNISLPSVTLLGTQSSYSVSLPNGSYYFSIQFGIGGAPVSGYVISPNYLSNSSQLIVRVNGSPFQISVTFTPLYKVTLSGTGLYAGTTWELSLKNGSSTINSGNISSEGLFSDDLANGTYTISYQYTLAGSIPAVGYYLPTESQLAVNGRNESVTVNFVPYYYVRFIGSGLPMNTIWKITFNHSNYSSNSSSSTLILFAQNGTYSLSVPVINGFIINNNESEVTVDGESINVYLNWTIVTYPITIDESGIIRGETWSATVAGTTFTGASVNVTETSNGTSVIFNEPNGTYSYSVHILNGYTGTNLSGRFTLAGNPLTESIHAFPSYNYLALPILAIAIIAITILTLVLYETRKRKRKVV